MKITASELNFTELLPPATPGGPPRRRGHYYAWGSCRACGELQLVARAGLKQRRCRMTPGCPGHLEPAADTQELPPAWLETAWAAFGPQVEVVEVTLELRELCGELLVEYGTAAARERKRRSWRCQREAGHEGHHETYSGHRTWEAS